MNPGNWKKAPGSSCCTAIPTPEPAGNSAAPPQVHRDGPVNDAVIARLSEAGLIQDPQGGGCAVVLRVDQVLTLFGEVLQQRTENLDW